RAQRCRSGHGRSWGRGGRRAAVWGGRGRERRRPEQGPRAGRRRAGRSRRSGSSAAGAQRAARTRSRRPPRSRGPRGGGPARPAFGGMALVTAGEETFAVDAIALEVTASREGLHVVELGVHGVRGHAARTAAGSLAVAGFELGPAPVADRATRPSPDGADEPA